MTDPNNAAPAGDPQPGASGQTPPAPQYGAPQQQTPPPAPQYGAPAAPQYGAPGAPQYGAPAYGAPAGRPAALTQDELSDITLDLWLSVFFAWIPALIFYLIRRDTASPLARKAYADNLNWQIVALIIGAASGILMFVFIGFITMFIPFVVSLIIAITVPGQLRQGQPGKFILAPSWVK